MRSLALKSRSDVHFCAVLYGIVRVVSKGMLWERRNVMWLSSFRRRAVLGVLLFVLILLCTVCFYLYSFVLFSWTELDSSRGQGMVAKLCSVREAKVIAPL